MKRIIFEGKVADVLTQRIHALASDTETLRKQIGEQGVEDIRAMIDTQQDVDGDALAPLKHPRPAGHNPDPRVLFDTGMAYLNLGYELGVDTVKFGTPDFYLQILNNGSASGDVFSEQRGGTPLAVHVEPRPVLGLRASMRTTIAEDVFGYAVDVFAGVGGDL